MLSSLTKMVEYNKESNKFSKRTKKTVKPYPDLNREALAQVYNELQEIITVQNTKSNNPDNNSKIEVNTFSKLYAKHL